MEDTTATNDVTELTTAQKIAATKAYNAAAKAEAKAEAEAEAAKSVELIDGLNPADYPTAYAFETAREIKYLSEKVPIQLPKDNENYKDDVTPCINGKVWQIQRGEPVLVPRQISDVLAQSQRQMMLADQKSIAAANVCLGER